MVLLCALEVLLANHFPFVRTSLASGGVGNSLPICVDFSCKWFQDPNYKREEDDMLFHLSISSTTVLSMDLIQFPSFPVFLAFSLLIFVVLKVLLKQNSKLPPGPRKLPLIGNFHQLVSPMPHHRITELAKRFGSVMHLQLGEISSVVISSPEAAKEAMKEQDVQFSGRPFVLAPSIMYYGSKDLILAQYGDYWRQVRKICVMELLSSKRVQSFRSIREEEVSTFIRLISLNTGMAINLSEMISSLVLDVVARASVGTKSRNREGFTATVDKFMEAAVGFSIADVFPSFGFLFSFSSRMIWRVKRMHKEADDMLEDIINDHKARMTKTGDSEADNLLNVLFNLQDHGNLEIPLTNESVKAVIMDIFTAGIDTTSSTTEWAMSEMLKHPRILRRAQEEVRLIFGDKGNVDETRLHELTFLKLIIKETLRLHPPAPLIPRACTEKCVVNGYEIPANAKVLINVWMIGRDPDYWVEADKFYPERFLDSSIDYKGTDFGYIPFGAGRRICPGMQFGIAAMELILAHLLYHFDWELPNGMTPENLDMTEAFGATLRRKKELILIPLLPCPLLLK